MAAYASTVAVDQPVRRVLAATGLGLITGTINITNYNQTTVPEITDITKYFRSTPRVICDGVSNGAVKQLVRWSAADKGFRAYVPTTGAETATDVNVGSVNFIAIGPAP